MLLVYTMATQGGRTPSGALLLTGVAVGAVPGSFSTFIISINLANQQMTQQIMFWTMGGLDARTWLHVQICWPFIAAGLIMAIYFSRDLDLLLQGEETAASLGMKVELTKRFVIVGASLLTGASVAVAGMVGFVGLIIPHAVRSIMGPSPRRLLPGAILAGCGFRDPV
jgi:iron complex transport system permease protein